MIFPKHLLDLAPVPGTREKEPPDFADVDPFDDAMERDPELLFEQACETLCFEVQRDQWLLAFARPFRIVAPDGVGADDGGMCDGCQIVAYTCDETGQVDTWRYRYEVEAPNFKSALIKLRFMMVNGLLNLCNYEE